jgi:VWFA-related protein
MRSAFAVLIVAALTVQQANPPPQPTFRTEANYVRVDVYPTKDDGPVGDLRVEDFEVFENGALQKIEQFEHIVIRGNLPDATRIEPNTVSESRAMLENSRARVFVLFLDPGHVDVASSHNIRRSLVETLNRMIGPDDLVGVMTPEMSARDVTLARKTGTIEGFLTKYWNWGERDRLNLVDPVEQQYEICYGPQNKSPITAEMIARRREKRALDAIQDLVRFLRGVREERKAILAVTDGWLLFRPNSALVRPVGDSPPPMAPPITVDPRTGTLTTKDPTSLSTIKSDCERDRMMLAQIDDQREFLQILDEANRANASFYPIDPRGLAVFDTPIDAGVPLLADAGMLRSRGESLRTLAGATDGTAIMTNDISGALRRVVDDLSSYYLLGYYSSGKLDGKFHSISARVKRPGIRVRARRGYLAASTAEADAAAAARANAVAVPSAEAAAEAHAIETALAPLPGYVRDTPLRTDAVAGWRRGADGKPAAAFWVIGEFSAGTPPGRSLDATVVAPSGTTAARATSDSGARNMLIALTPTDAMEPGEYTIRVRGEGFGFATIRVKLPPPPEPGGAVFFRRGQTTGNQTVVTADRRFRRGEQLRMEMPLPAGGTPTARLLDRTGKALAVPVTMSARDDGAGTSWQTAQLALAPLAPSDYIIEITNGTNRTMFGFRVVP